MNYSSKSSLPVWPIGFWFSARTSQRSTSVHSSTHTVYILAWPGSCQDRIYTCSVCVCVCVCVSWCASSHSYQHSFPSLHTFALSYPLPHPGPHPQPPTTVCYLLRNVLQLCAAVLLLTRTISTSVLFGSSL